MLSGLRFCLIEYKNSVLLLQYDLMENWRLLVDIFFLYYLLKYYIECIISSVKITITTKISTATTRYI